MKTRIVVGGPMQIRLSAWLFLFALGAASPVVAQQDSVRPPAATPYRIVGTVANPQGTPVFDAEIAVVERDSVVRRVRSDSSGKFHLEALSTPSVRLRVRRVGFRAEDLVVYADKANRTASVYVTLEPTVARLDTVQVADDSAPATPDARLIAFRARASSNSFGHYVTEEMLARLRPNLASDALRSVSGVLVRSAGSKQVGNIVRLRGCGARDQSPERTGPLVWLDGVRLPGAELDEVASGPDVAAIEIYNSFAGVPSQYFDRSAVCGTILVWTKLR